ncbi:MAG TPA: hypothetical protein ENK66_09015, partial [Arcobacter sp.]|nr:hypothetical protein [Arcobacter sp.]
MVIIRFFLFMWLVVLLNGCAQKANVKSLEPAIISDPSIKEVSIAKFKNDSVNLRESIVSQMDNISFSNKKFFTIVNREDVEQILEEQKLQDSGLVKNRGDEEYGLRDISSIISGKITTKTKKTSKYKEERTNYDKCIKYSK